eukprot:jgi/Undpi1/5276/HiC_scaffold_2.g00557.m1
MVCGVCASDCFAVLGTFAGPYPTIPGHEVIGKVIKRGEGLIAQAFAEGDMVGVGWHAGHCFACEACTDGDFVSCSKQRVSGIHIGGGYQEYMVAPAMNLARVPKGMDPIDAAPLACAGVTVFNSLRNCVGKAKPPAIVAVVGIGGLGHLGISYAAKCGYTVVAISRGDSKRETSLKLGAKHFIDSEAEDVNAALQALGGARVILCTTGNAKAMDCVDGLSRDGTLVILGISEEKIVLTPLQLIVNRKTVQGYLTGTGRDIQDTIEFAHIHGIKPKTVVYEGIDNAPEAYKAMRNGDYRVVIRVATE